MTTPTKLDILIQTGYATEAECEAMIRLGRNAIVRSQHTVAGWDGRMQTCYPEGLVANPLYKALCNRIVTRIRGHYGVNVRLDCGLIVQMLQGSAHGRHADAELEDGSPNHTPHRTHVGLLYLNSILTDYDGGEITIADERYAPMKGDLICFPSTHQYMHEVAEVTRGERWSLNVWTMH